MGDKKILVVHDDAALLKRIQDGIAATGAGFDITNAISGPRAVGMASSTHPDVIVVDGDLVGMDGYELTKQLKTDPELADTPIIILAIEPSEATAMKARQAGAAAHMPAAVAPEALVDKIRLLASNGIGDGGGNGQAAATAAAPAEQAAPAAAADYRVPTPVGDAGAAPHGQADYGVPSPVAPTEDYLAPEAVKAAVNPDAPDPDIPHVDDLLRLMIERGGSDLHLTVGSPPGIRVRGEIEPVDSLKSLSPRDTMSMLLTMLSEEQRRRFETELELDFAYSIPGVSRFRANIFQQRNSMGAVFRVIPLKIPTLEDLGLPKVCRYLAERPRGLVLVTGPTGSGKSTTLAAMIDHINATKRVHIITLEDPIEFIHKNKMAYVNQREVGEDTHSFAAALKRVLRQDPDVILVGEMRDLETISAAITAAETGHLVLATLHTTGGPETVDRVIDVFPPHQQQQVRLQLSTTLEGVLSQVLLRSTDGRNRVMAMEIMLGIPAVCNLIREGKTHQMATIIQGGAQFGMQTLDQHLRTLLQGGRITFEEAVGKAQNPSELAQMVGRRI